MAKEQKLIQFNKLHIATAIKWQIQLISELADIVDSLQPQTIDRMSIILSVLWQCYENSPDNSTKNRA